MTQLLRAEGLTFGYDAGVVLHRVAVVLNGGEVVALIGPNGSGKSTLIKVLIGLLRGEGTVEWEGREIGIWKRRQLARRVAYLPQTPACEGGQTVAEVLRLGRAPYWGAFGVESLRDAEVVGEVSQTLGLGELMNRRMEEISGGQRQRVFIGRCLIQEPAAMLLDEPNTFLDLKHQVELGELLRRLAKERGIGVLMASHDLNLAGAFADRMVLLCGGKVVKSGAVGEVLDAELLSRVYGVRMERVERAGGSPVVIPVVPD
ncbi:MAG: ABC transporter ATP-binding protein [Planctomycetota bacterium]|nr:ABC transporter ATP-binding protein [Planctomycetota bacterium]